MFCGFVFCYGICWEVVGSCGFGSCGVGARLGGNVRARLCCDSFFFGWE